MFVLRGSKLKSLLIILLILGLLFLVFGIFRITNSDMQSAMRQSELNQALNGESPNAVLENYFYLSYASLYIGFSLIIISLTILFRVLVEPIVLKHHLFNIGSTILGLSIIGTFFTITETKKPLNNLYILASKEGILELTPYLRTIINLEIIFIIILVLSAISVLVSLIKRK